MALGYSDVWKLFGEGRHENFRELLITKLAPHMSSLAVQYWLHKGPAAFQNGGLYATGGSRHALTLVAWLFRTLGMKGEVKRYVLSRRPFKFPQNLEFWLTQTTDFALHRL